MLWVNDFNIFGVPPNHCIPPLSFITQTMIADWVTTVGWKPRFWICMIKDTWGLAYTGPTRTTWLPGSNWLIWCSNALTRTTTVKLMPANFHRWGKKFDLDLNHIIISMLLLLHPHIPFASVHHCFFCQWLIQVKIQAHLRRMFPLVVLRF